MTGKRFAVVGLFVFAALIGAPRPAHAQWIDFMRWLSSLDPGPFDIFTTGVSVACKLKPVPKAELERRPATPRPETVVKGWDLGPGCESRSDGHWTPFYVSAVYGQGWTPHSNLIFSTNHGPGSDITVNLIGGAPTYRLEWRPGSRVDLGVDASAFVGKATFGGASPTFTRLLIQPTGIVRLNFRVNWGRVHGIEFSTGYGGAVFPEGFTLEDFGAVGRVNPEEGQLDGKAEFLWARTYGRVTFHIR